MLSWMWHTLYIYRSPQSSPGYIQSISLWVVSIKQHHLYCTYLSWCQPSICLYFPNIPLSAPNIWASHSYQRTCSVFPLLSSQQYTLLSSHCAAFHCLIHSPSVLVVNLHLCWSWSNSLWMLIRLSKVHSPTRPPHTDPSVSWFHCSTAVV